MMRSVDAIRATHPAWHICRVEADERGEDEFFMEGGTFWSEAEARSECARLQQIQTNPAVRYEALVAEATVVYPADETPPWVPDPDRLRRRGYERLDAPDPPAS